MHDLGGPLIDMAKVEQRCHIKVKADLVQNFSGEDIKSAESRCGAGRRTQQRMPDGPMTGWVDSGNSKVPVATGICSDS